MTMLNISHNKLNKKIDLSVYKSGINIFYKDYYKNF